MKIRPATALALAFVLATTVIACGLFKNEEIVKRGVRPGEPKTSPSGLYTAYAEEGPLQNTVKTWVDVIRDKDGNEVFRDDDAYSTRHGVLFTWLSTEPNQLWIISGDVGTFYVSPDQNGIWTKHLGHDSPQEIVDLRGY